MAEKTQNDAGTAVAADTAVATDTAVPTPAPEKPAEIGGPKGLDPVRYGDWERNGKCVDF
ncbi:DUF1674 domain-containing protein [Tistrella mobilis]|jgi:hypothetical protein|uniref:DUF1674 domain-containing protein n=1 Tax=Tistrella mobilis TaxID=171437 RepID=UPI0035572AF8